MGATMDVPGGPQCCFPALPSRSPECPSKAESQRGDEELLAPQKTSPLSSWTPCRGAGPAREGDDRIHTGPWAGVPFSSPSPPSVLAVSGVSPTPSWPQKGPYCGSSKPPEAVIPFFKRVKPLRHKFNAKMQPSQTNNTPTPNQKHPRFKFPCIFE